MSSASRCSRCGGVFDDSHAGGCPNLGHTADKPVSTYRPLDDVDRVNGLSGVAAARKALKDSQ